MHLAGEAQRRDFLAADCFVSQQFGQQLEGLVAQPRGILLVNIRGQTGDIRAIGCRMERQRLEGLDLQSQCAKLGGAYI